MGRLLQCLPIKKVAPFFIPRHAFGTGLAVGKIGVRALVGIIKRNLFVHSKSNANDNVCLKRMSSNGFRPMFNEKNLIIRKESVRNLLLGLPPGFQRWKVSYASPTLAMYSTHAQKVCPIGTPKCDRSIAKKFIAHAIKIKLVPIKNVPCPKNPELCIAQTMTKLNVVNSIGPPAGEVL